MRRSGPLRSDPDKVRAWRSRSKPLSRAPRRASGEVPPEAKRLIRENVYRRDDWTCVFQGWPSAGRCFGPLTPHHRRKSSQGGDYSMENLVTACAHHNDLLEADADFAAAAREQGHVVRRGDPGWDRLG